MYDTDELNRIADRLSIADYIESTGEMPERRSGDNLYFKCKNNDEDHASCCVDTRKNYYYCFSCRSGQGGGNLLSYLINECGMPFKDAADEIVRLSGGSYEPNMGNSETLQFLRQAKKRSIKRPIEKVREYGDYSKYLSTYKKEYPEEWLKEGITKEAMDRYDIRVDNYGMRIVYPVYDENGKYICAKGRTRLKDYKQLGLSKYQNYGKIGTVTYFQGLQQARKSVGETGEVIIFEGLKSVLKCYGWGIFNTVSSETSSINKYQIKLLISSHIRNIVIAFDKDKELSVIKSHLWLLPNFANVSIIIDRENLLGEKESPVDKGADVFKRLYEHRIRI